MFGNNHSWLNAYGMSFPNRVETCYLEIEVVLNFSAVSQLESGNQGSIEILPEVYGTSIGSETPIASIDNLYFKHSEEEKIFLGKTPLSLQIDL